MAYSIWWQHRIERPNQEKQQEETYEVGNDS